MGFISRKVPKHYAKKKGIPKGFRKASRFAYKYQPGMSKLIKGANLALKVLNSERLIKQEAITLSFNNSQTSAANVIHLSDIDQGDGQTQRTGNSVRYNSLAWNLNFIQHASATNTAIKMVIFQDTAVPLDHTTKPLITDMYEAQPTLPLQAMMNRDNVGRYRILFETAFYLHSVSDPTKLISGTIQPRNHGKWTGPLGTDLGSGQLYVMFITNESTNLPTVQGFVRTRYYDN